MIKQGDKKNKIIKTIALKTPSVEYDEHQEIVAYDIGLVNQLIELDNEEGGFDRNTVIRKGTKFNDLSLRY